MPELNAVSFPPSPFAPGAAADARAAGALTVLELDVRNHPGAMSHITGLFARRAFNLEAIACAPTGDGTTSRMLLLVAGGPRLDQVQRQLERLHDVRAVRLRRDLCPEVFQRMILGAAS